MKKILYNGFVKFLLVVTLCIGVVMAGVSAFLLEYSSRGALVDLDGFYASGIAYDWVEKNVEWVNAAVYNNLSAGEDAFKNITVPRGMAFRIVNEEGETLSAAFGRGSELGATADERLEDYFCVCSMRNSYLFLKSSKDAYSNIGGITPYSIEGYIAKEIQKSDAAYNIYLLYTLMEEQDLLVALLVIGGVSAFVSLVALICGAGRNADGELDLSGWHRIPFEIYILLCVIASAFVQQLCAEMLDLFINTRLQVTVVLATVGFLGLELLSVIITVAARFKGGRWWRNTVTFMCLKLGYKIIKFMLRLCGKVAKAVLHLIHSLPAAWREGGICAAVILLNMLLGAGSHADDFFGIILLIDIAAVAAVIVMTVQMKRLKLAGEQLAAGNLEYTPDIDTLHGAFRRHGENLGSVREGMEQAVEKQLKSEHMRTELITNVSHDLKTPLTNIISYVDLLKKEPAGSEKAQEYLDVLERQGMRLKKLTEDLVEASKANVGAVEICREVLDLHEFSDQMVGEYGDRFEKQDLKLINATDEGSVYVMADGRQLGRVFDNLLLNALKYSMPGTRVYYTLKKQDNAAVVTIKNTSKEQLNISADELMERFVRGDSSRHTEGSGLGLSIARSLMKLMDGDVQLHLDGDLFKVSVTLPLAPPKAVAAAVAQKKEDIVVLAPGDAEPEQTSDEQVLDESAEQAACDECCERQSECESIEQPITEESVAEETCGEESVEERCGDESAESADEKPAKKPVTAKPPKSK